MCTMLFRSIVTVIFQRTFRTEMHQNDIFFYFLKSAHQNDPKHTKKINFLQKKKLKFFGNTVCTKKKYTGLYQQQI